jgi:kinesin family protein 4/21/27
MSYILAFMSVHNTQEEVRDLLITGSGPRAAVSIREVPGGGVSLAGAVEKEVKSLDEMVAVLEMGTLCRATASTNMNNR